MIFNCQKLASTRLEEIRKDITDRLSLGVVQIGEDSVSSVFINEKRKAAEKLGINFNHYQFSEDISLKILREKMKKFTDEGIIIQLPIKGRLETQKALNLIPFEKDVDVLSEKSLGKFYTGRLDILPPVVWAVDQVLKANRIDIAKKHLVVVGPGRLVGKPTALYAAKRKATVSVVGKSSPNKEKVIKMADVVVTGVGKPKIITGNMIKKGAVVIDAGTSKIDGVLTGDVDTESVKEKALVTPVPGGVGPLTVVGLLNNLVRNAQS